ncbi:alpha/beta hydrolase fold domain-containing protein [Maribellus comscasis]|uniref:Alpha/beta hydrolase fold domain-containing protein n=1 Tax=Maribellus comscasis TaxID=2681766 RepID=A0A6I6K243_9BACT|nr:alpha/beta hydrolase [Maribellus comscasis]QGY47528.1 alpha/beta hydrolase fold domain-containing protein [Maribellus comscasis]
MKIISLVTIICCFSLIFDANAQTEYPPHIDGAEEITYKTVDGTSLNLWIFTPEKHKSTNSAPAIIFFFGGGWKTGSPTQFVKHCEYLSARGMVAIVADYRVKSRHGVHPNVCVSDAKSAIRWVRENASELGVDSDRLAAGGGSAGGHLAAACATLPKFDDVNENKSISSKPNALVLFNPALVLATTDDFEKALNEKIGGLVERMGPKPEDMSPYHNVVGKLPPTIIFHGTGDNTVPFISAELFTKKMHKFGNKCTLVAYQGEPHGFFNYGKNSNAVFIDTVNKMDEFLVSLGYLKAPPKTFIYNN